MTLNVVNYLNGSLRNILRIRMARSISTVDPKEMEHFATLKDTWWDEKGKINALHSFNPFRIQMIKDGLVNAGVKIQNSDLPLKGIKIVDVGCGGGILTEDLAKHGAQVTGIDVCPELIDVAKEHVKLNPDVSRRVNYIHTTVEDFAKKERENTYDVIVVSQVLLFVPDAEQFLKDCVKLVKPGKSIFITTMNKTLTCWLINVIAAEYIIRSIPPGMFTWNRFTAPHEIQRRLKNCGCETALIHGMKYNPMTKRWSWSSSTSTFYGLYAIKRKDIDV